MTNQPVIWVLGILVLLAWDARAKSISIDYTYDNLGRLTSARYTENTTIYASIGFTYDPAGNILASNVTQLDSDTDGVNDTLDQCPNTPSGESVNDTGCSLSQLDTDGDGVSDAMDLCPSTSTSETVDSSGCSLSQIDTDSDGVHDDLDLCPSTPLEEVVDNSGCSEYQLTYDSDSDGVSDALDQCPNTPSGDVVDVSGCSASQQTSDSDSDGISDALDQCPNTPTGESVNGVGCSLSQIDTDGDGISDVLDQCPSTSTDETVNDSGCSLSQLDSDNDDIDDFLDNCPLIANPDQSDRDNDGIGDSCDTNHAPVITQEAATLASTGLLTLVTADQLSATASDIEDGALAPQANDIPAYYSPGRHQIGWTVIDSDGNVASATQIMDIIPMVDLGPDQWATVDGETTIDVHLNGSAPAYPVTIGCALDEYDNNGRKINATQYSPCVEIMSGEIGSLDIVLSDTSAYADFTLNEFVGAVSGEKVIQRITRTTAQLLPRVSITLVQGPQELPVSTIVTDGGSVTVQADAVDFNNDALSIDWSGTDELMSPPNEGSEFSFNPNTLSEGSYRIALRVSDGISATQVELTVRVIQGSEVLLDNDTDGIADTMDEDDLPGNVLQGYESFNDSYLLNSEPGVKVSLGAMARTYGSVSANISGNINFATGYTNVGGIFDYRIEGLPVAGMQTGVVIPLHAPIPTGAIALKYSETAGWNEFTEDAYNHLSSVDGVAGICPPVGDSTYLPGLKDGAYCIQVTLTDGGPNDADGHTNYQIDDPIGLGVVESTPADPDGGGGGGGALGYFTLLMLLLVRTSTVLVYTLRWSCLVRNRRKVFTGYKEI